MAENKSEGDRRAVGVYDRPASADRAQARKRWIMAGAIAIAAAIGVATMYLLR